MSLSGSHAVLPATPDLMVTRRLTLRPASIDDLDALHALLAQPGVRRHLCDNRMLVRSEVAVMLSTSMRLRETAGTGLWTLFENARPSALAGVAGWWPYRHVDFPEVSELLFALAETHWGRGLAMEAGVAILDHARDVLGWREAQASTHLGNNASIRTLWRLDFTEAEIVRGPAGALRIFRRPL